MKHGSVSTQSNKHLIAIAGPPSSRKTTTATIVRAMTTGSRDIIKEFARDWIERHGAISGVTGQLVVMYQQQQWEQRALGVYRWAISDSPQFLSYIYCTLGGNIDITNSEQREILTMVYDHSVRSLMDYSRIYLLTPKPVVSDGVRAQDDDDAQLIYRRIKEFLDMHIPYGYVEIDEQENMERGRIIVNDLVAMGIISDDEVAKEFKVSSDNHGT
jgi:hypothetical protein